jgi:hypothetical protein
VLRRAGCDEMRDAGLPHNNVLPEPASSVLHPSRNTKSSGRALATARAMATPATYPPAIPAPVTCA